MNRSPIVKTLEEKIQSILEIINVQSTSQAHALLYDLGLWICVGKWNISNQVDTILYFYMCGLTSVFFIKRRNTFLKMFFMHQVPGQKRLCPLYGVDQPSAITVGVSTPAS